MMISAAYRIFPFKKTSSKLIERQIVDGTKAFRFELHKAQVGKQENHKKLGFFVRHLVWSC